MCALLALTLMSFQCVRRFYETWFVSVFSEGKINLSHYLVGFVHYWGAISVILAESKGFSYSGRMNPFHFKLHVLIFFFFKVFLRCGCRSCQRWM